MFFQSVNTCNSVSLWLCIVAAVGLVTVTIYLIERIAYRGPHKDDDQSRLGLSDSGWMVFSSLVQVNTNFPYEINAFKI